MKKRQMLAELQSGTTDEVISKIEKLKERNLWNKFSFINLYTQVMRKSGKDSEQMLFVESEADKDWLDGVYFLERMAEK